MDDAKARPETPTLTEMAKRLPEAQAAMSKAPKKVQQAFARIIRAGAVAAQARSPEMWCSAVVDYCRGMENMAKLLNAWPHADGAAERMRAARSLNAAAKDGHNLVVDMANPAVSADAIVPKKTALEAAASAAEAETLLAIGTTVGLVEPDDG